MYETESSLILWLSGINEIFLVNSINATRVVNYNTFVIGFINLIIILEIGELNT